MSELCLVTGGAGFIGSHLVEALTARGYRVRVFDNFSTGLASNLAGIHPAPEIITGDLTDPDQVRAAVQGARIIFHLGALASVTRSIETPLVSHAACATGTLNVLDAARQAGVGRLVYAASSSVYGGYSQPGGQTEDLPWQPQSPYAAAKLAGELYCQACSASYGLETVRLRFFNIFGPRQRSDSPYSGVIAIFTALMHAGKSPLVHGDGLQSRDFTYVGNAVQCLIRAALTPGVSGRVYNVGTGTSHTLLDLIQNLNQLLGTNLQPRFGDPRAGDVRFSQANIDRARQELHYQPDISFAEGLKRTLAWYQSTLAGSAG